MRMSKTPADRIAPGAPILPTAQEIEGPPDDILMRRIIEKSDQEAFATLVERYRRKLFATCYRMLGDSQEAEDAVQDSFLKLWNYAESWDPAKAKLSTWL